MADLSFAPSERFAADSLLTRITALPRGDGWANLARSSLRYDLCSALAGLTADVLTSTEDGPPSARIAEWERRNAEGLARARTTLDAVLGSDGAEGGGADTSSLAAVSVALRAVRTLLSTA